MGLEFWISIAIPVAGFVVGLFTNKLMPGGSPATPKPNPPGLDAVDAENVLAAIAEKIRQVRGGPVAPGQSTRPILDALTKLFREEAAPLIPTVIPDVPGTQLDDVIRKIADAVVNRLKPTSAA